MEDRRKEFKNHHWQQGRLLVTRITETWDDERKKEVDNEEKKCCFVNFFSGDDGRDRILVYKFDTVKECEKTIEKHNNKLIKDYYNLIK